MTPYILKFAAQSGSWEVFAASLRVYGVDGFRFKDVRVRVGNPDRFLFIVEFDDKAQAAKAKLVGDYEAD